MPALHSIGIIVLPFFGNTVECFKSSVLGWRIRKVSVNITLPYDCVIVDYMEAYELHNINIEEAIAVKLKDTDEYYLFRNIDYFNDKK